MKLLLPLFEFELKKEVHYLYSYTIYHFPTLPPLRRIAQAINKDNNFILQRLNSIDNLLTIREPIQSV